MKSNPIFQVLVASNPAILGAGGLPSTLGVGQLGIFNAETNLSFDPAGSIPDKFYFAVGLDTVESGILTDIRRSAGEYISKKLVNTVFGKAPVAGANQVLSLNLTGFVPDDVDYTIHTEWISGQLMNLSGFTNPRKSFVITGTTGQTLAQFINAFVAYINADEEGLIVASNSGNTHLVLTVGKELKSKTIGGINPRYDFLRQFQVKFAFSDGFEDQPTVVVAANTPAVYEEGSGYDIQQEEYIAGGWIGKPGIYRDSALNGLFATGDFEPLAVKSLMYYQTWFNYNYNSNSGGMLNYSNQMQTLIAVPNTTDDNVDFSPLHVKISALAATLIGTDATAGYVEAYTADE